MGVEIQPLTAVLSALRRAAAGEKVAVLLDGAQAASLGSLPFASSLAVISTSSPMPVAVLATVAKRIDAGRWKSVEPAFRRIGDDPVARDALEGVRLSSFVPLDEAALAAARTAYRRGK
jgi:hypothetical protein